MDEYYEKLDMAMWEYEESLYEESIFRDLMDETSTREEREMLKETIE